MFCVCRLGDVVNLYIGMFLVPDVIDKSELGSVIPLTRLAALVGVPFAVLARSASKCINMLLNREEYGKIKSILRHLSFLAASISILIVGFGWLLWPFVMERLKVSTFGTLIGILIVTTAVVACWLKPLTMATQGLRGFYRLTLAKVLGPIARLVAIVFFLQSLQVAGYLLASVVSSLAIVALLSVGVVREFPKSVARVSYREHWPMLKRYAFMILAATVATNLQNTVEPWVIRQRLSLDASAGYYITALFGNIPRFVAPAMLPFMFTLVSERFERGESTRLMHRQSLGFVLLVGLFSGAVVFFLGERILLMRETWSLYVSYAPFMFPLSLIATVDVLLGVHITHENACSRFRYLRYYVPVVMGGAALLYSLMGWGFFKPYLPASIWLAVDGFVVRDLTFIVGFMVASRLVLLFFMSFDIFRAEAGTLVCPEREARERNSC